MRLLLKINIAFAMHSDDLYGVRDVAAMRWPDEVILFCEHFRRGAKIVMTDVDWWTFTLKSMTLIAQKRKDRQFKLD